MKKIALAVLFILVLAPGAFAYDWMLESRIYGGAVAPMSEEWEELYNESIIGQFGLAVASDLLYGFGPYFAFAGGVAENRFDGILVRFSHADFAVGVQYRYEILPWLAPGIHVAPMVSQIDERIEDDYLGYEMDETAFGLEVGQEWNFYPFYWSGRIGKGLGFYLAFIYQYRPLSEFGDLENVSGWGGHAGMQYKWDFGRKPIPERPTHLQEPPPPPPQPVAPPEPPAPPAPPAPPEEPEGDRE